MTRLRSHTPLLIVVSIVLIAVATYGIVHSQSANGKYDTDGDGLIEINYLEQLNAIRYDTNGDGRPNDDPNDNYSVSFPTAEGERVCNQFCRGYELARSLDFEDAGSYASGKVNTQWTTGSGWLPIGLKEQRFNTTFDGNGHTISNLYIDRTTPLVGTERIGLFGYTYLSTVFREIGLLDVDVTGVSWVGGLVGSNRGAIISSYATGDVSGSSTVGGLAGGNGGQIISSYSTVNVSGSTTVGGLNGWNWGSGTIIACYATGNVRGNFRIGSLIGANSSTSSIITSYSTGVVSGNNTIGGLIGSNDDGGTVIDSLWDTRSTGQRIGIGVGDSTGALGNTTSELQSPTDYDGIYATWKIDLDNADRDFDPSTGVDDVWDFGTSRQYPILKVDTNEDGTATWWEFGKQIGNRPTPTPTHTPRPTSTPRPTNTPTLTPIPTHTPTHKHTDTSQYAYANIYEHANTNSNTYRHTHTYTYRTHLSQRLRQSPLKHLRTRLLQSQALHLYLPPRHLPPPLCHLLIRPRQRQHLNRPRRQPHRQRQRRRRRQSPVAADADSRMGRCRLALSPPTCFCWRPRWA